MTQPRILAFAGSARRDSFNKKLARAAAEAARNAGAEVTFLDFADYPMPLFDQDLEAEEGAPENARRFKEQLLSHQGLLIACPEYNSSITPLLKNAIDWASRATEKGEAPLSAFRDKTAGLLATSPGKLGGLRGLVHVRSILQNIGVIVVPRQVAVPGAHQAFDDEGALTDERMRSNVESLAQDLVDVTRKLIG